MLAIRNHHTASCGNPPDFNQLPHSYLGYFENEEREQFVFLFDHRSKTGTLFCGDAGWENAYTISGAEQIQIILSPAERAWLTVCWITCHCHIGANYPPLHFFDPLEPEYG